MLVLGKRHTESQTEKQKYFSACNEISKAPFNEKTIPYVLFGSAEYEKHKEINNRKVKMPGKLAVTIATS